jgi:hypothetical protein
MNVRAIVSLAALLAGTSRPLTADMGRVLTSDVAVEETAQKAIILHNLSEEVLILGTDLEGVGPAGLLRFIPFPAEPRVGVAPAEVFTRLAALVDSRHLQYVSFTKNRGAQPAQPVELRFAERLGAHDLTVVRVNQAAEFRAWVDDYFRRKGFTPGRDLEAVMSVVADYVRDGLIYFVIDYVQLPGNPRSVDPLVITFKSDQLYYPLRTSNTFGGRGEIALFLLTPRTLFRGPIFDFPGDGYAEPSTSVAVRPDELRGILPAAESFFGPEPLFLQAVRWRGPYQFDRDLRLDLARASDRPWEVSEHSSSPLDGLLDGLRDGRP